MKSSSWRLQYFLSAEAAEWCCLGERLFEGSMVCALLARDVIWQSVIGSFFVRSDFAKHT
jgi:DNA-binding transcriptional regulator YdaS (Cro superfamily)